ncbi:uncharacterized protein LOC111711823 isoform X2 [Eurytemora carolleeae]|uniref:uncharacterized protein LOC111711823 isoform X2 n=1 Tax=Eurytemora carolleeae TaxID=1294199 RepID=UPI000C77BB19|nr:uncharacterized protein LOC111711823 isoform X2 [Eurytemora carolleeae]|eukprot:XP_023342042.1 uncharacterized protein LOC111711823 isoform X2 [Eurytemora affinis]
MRLNIYVVFTLGLISQAASDCSIEPPIKDGEDGIGLIFVPGATISGEAYLPILRKIQENYPGSLWIGATTAWLNNFPNPIEIGGQINDCLSIAEISGLSTERVFFGGHSLGGIVLESYISGHAELAQGIILLGTWLPDLLRADNEFPVPVLTAIGEIDGGGISYLRREYFETKDLSPEVQMKTKTILVPQVNHGQVASGELPDGVITDDIDPELSEEEAHTNYAVRVSDWLILNNETISEQEKRTAERNFDDYDTETFNFLKPFSAMFEQETQSSYSPFTQQAQLELLQVAISDNLEVKDEIVDAGTFQLKQPSLEVNPQTGLVMVGTVTHLTFDLDILDHNHYKSASTLKAKMKSADSIYSAVELPETGQFISCSELNKASLDLALSVASQTALNRLKEKGRNLTFLPDHEMGWGGISWELSGKLEWAEVSPGEATLKSSRLTSGVDFPLFPGVQYCDILSPYRALEWIYVESIRNTMTL